MVCVRSRFFSHATASSAMRSSICSPRLTLFKVGILIAPRCKVTGLWSGAVPMRNVDIEPEFQRRMWFPPQVPLSEMRGCVAFVLQERCPSVGID